MCVQTVRNTPIDNIQPQLYNVYNNLQNLQYFTRIYKTLQIFPKLYKYLHNFTNIYTTLQNYTNVVANLDKILQQSTKLYKKCTTLYKYLQHFLSNNYTNLYKFP